MTRFLGTHIGPNVGAAPSSPSIGQLYFNTSNNRLYVWDNAAWSELTLAAKGGPFLALAGSAGAPVFSFLSDSNTGMYSAGIDAIEFSVGGTARLRVDIASPHVSTTGVLSATGDTFSAAFKASSLGSVTAPVHTFQADTNTGVYSSGADILDFTTGGGNRLSISTTTITAASNLQVNGTVNATGTVTGKAGTAGAPAYVFSGATGTGTYGSTSEFDIAVNGTNFARWIDSPKQVIFNNATLYGLLDSSAPDSAATRGYVDSVAQGLDAKGSVRAASTGNVASLTGTMTIDGVALIAGDRVLLKDQTTAALNGIYVVAAGAWSRSTDMDSWAEIPGAYSWVEEGTTNSDTGWVATANQGGTLGTTAITWAKFSSAVASGLGRYTISIGDGSATSYTVTHGLSTQNCIVQVYEAGSPYNVVYPDVQMTTSTTCTIIFAVAPTTNQYTVVVIG